MFNNFVPVVTGRGVVQVSGYVDNLLASLLPTGAVAALNYAQILYMLPVSLFGMAVAAAELPGMSRATGASSEIALMLRGRLNAGLRQISFLVSALGGGVPVPRRHGRGGDLQSGHFTRADAVYVLGDAGGLRGRPAGGNDGASIFVGVLRAVGYAHAAPVRDNPSDADRRARRLCVIPLPPMIGIAHRWGVAGLTASAGMAGWIEFAMLRASLNRRIGATGIERSFVIRLWAMAIAASAAAYVVKLYVGGAGPRLSALAVLPVYGSIYFGSAYWMDLPELHRFTGRLLPRSSSKSRT